MTWWNSTKAKVISIGSFLAGVAAITTFFNVDIPKNAYIVDVAAAEQRQQQRLDISVADSLVFQIRLIKSDIRAVNRAIAENGAAIRKTDVTTDPGLIRNQADLSSDLAEYRLELESLKLRLREIKESSR